MRLLLDASSRPVQVGILREDRWLAYHESDSEALDALFSGTQEILSQAGVELNQIEGFIYCQGPGSVLGIRLASMAINCWRSLPPHRHAPLFTYCSLEVAAHLLLAKGTPPPFAVVSDYQRDSWNLLAVTRNGSLRPLRQRKPGEIAESKTPLYYIDHGKRTKVPSLPSARAFSYRFAEEPGIFSRDGILQEVDRAAPRHLRQPHYVRWEAKRHHRP